MRRAWQRGRAVLPDEAVIRRLAAVRADGLTMQQLAMRFHCSPVTIGRKLAELPILPTIAAPASFCDLAALAIFPAEREPGP